MVKKIVLGALLAGLIGVLVIGAVIRTQDKTSRNEGGQGAGNGSGQGTGSGRVSAADWVTVDAAVAALDASELSLNVDGDAVTIQGRAWSYAQDAGLMFSTGDRLRLTGFYDESGLFEPGRIENLSTGQTVVLRDDGGRPMWAGGGRGQG
jgi:hypothetical protein